MRLEQGPELAGPHAGKASEGGEVRLCRRHPLAAQADGGHDAA